MLLKFKNIIVAWYRRKGHFLPHKPHEPQQIDLESFLRLLNLFKHYVSWRVAQLLL